jgi:uncharacterized phiE125 gp8 family phage protein
LSRASYKQTVKPQGTPVSLEEVMGAARIDAPEDNGLLLGLIDAATEYVQKHQWSQLVSATWEMRLCDFPCRDIPLHPNPVASITSVTYVDSGGTTRTLTQNTDYVLDSKCQPAILRPAYNVAWPTTRGYVNDVTITLVAGYGTPADVPPIIKQAILMMVKQWYEGCGETAIPFAAEAMLGCNNYAGFA